MHELLLEGKLLHRATTYRMLAEDRAAIDSLIRRIESWPSAAAQLGGPSDGVSPTKTLAGGRARAPRVRVSTDQPRLSSSLHAPASCKSCMMASGQPQRPPVHCHKPTVGPNLGPGSHDISAGNLKAREPGRPSPEFRTGKLRPLLPVRRTDPCEGLGGVSGAHGVPDLLTLRREKAPSLSSCSFVSCVERFGEGELLRRLRLEDARPTPVSRLPLDTELVTPTWDWDDGVPPEPSSLRFGPLRSND